MNLDLNSRKNNSIKMVLYIMDKSRMETSDMAMEFRYGQMVVNMKDSG